MCPLERCWNIHVENGILVAPMLLPIYYSIFEDLRCIYMSVFCTQSDIKFKTTLVGEALMKGKAKYGWPPVLTSLDLLLLYCKYSLPLCKTNCLNEEVNCTEPFS